MVCCCLHKPFPGPCVDAKWLGGRTTYLPHPISQTRTQAQGQGLSQGCAVNLMPS